MNFTLKKLIFFCKKRFPFNSLSLLGHETWSQQTPKKKKEKKKRFFVILRKKRERA
jgi:hypothetical protein